MDGADGVGIELVVGGEEGEVLGWACGFLNLHE